MIFLLINVVLLIILIKVLVNVQDSDHHQQQQLQTREQLRRSNVIEILNTNQTSNNLV